MKRPDRKKIYKRAIQAFGMKPQLGMLMEESAELIQATNKVLRRGIENQSAIQMLAEEMADVEIMIEQIKLYINWMLLEEKVEKAKEHKLRQLIVKIEAQEVRNEKM